MPCQDTTLTRKQVAGSAAEDVAVTRLEHAGLDILTCNYRVRGGEIDCIVLDGSMLAMLRSENILWLTGQSITEQPHGFASPR